MKIPRTIHTVWIGDERRRPDACIRSWREQNPSWSVRVWGNHELVSTPWVNRRHIEAMMLREWNGVADLMRWEILLRHGGFAVDADSVALRPLDDVLFEGPHDVFASWENEEAAPGLLAAGYVAARPRSSFIAGIVESIRRDRTVVNEGAWRTVGPLRLTRAWQASEDSSRVHVWPSRLFLPEHHSGTRCSENGERPYAMQLWATTRNLYAHVA